MYLPKHFEETDITVLHALIKTHPLGAWVTHSGDELIVNHIPFLIDADAGAHGTLIGHVARANPIWRAFSNAVPSVVIFQGPQSYITPSWYPSKQAHGKAVPTWNYAVVHAHGTPRAIEESAWLLKHVNALTREHEAQRALPWKVSDAPADYIDKMLTAIVGIEIPISILQGKWKVSQNRQQPDRLGVVAGLETHGNDESREMAQLVSHYAKQVHES